MVKGKIYENVSEICNDLYYNKCTFYLSGEELKIKPGCLFENCSFRNSRYLYISINGGTYDRNDKYIDTYSTFDNCNFSGDLHLILGCDNLESIDFRGVNDKVKAITINNVIFKSIKGIGNFPNLEFIDLSKTLLKNFSEEIISLSRLTTIYAHDTLVEEIPNYLSKSSVQMVKCGSFTNFPQNSWAEFSVNTKDDTKYVGRLKEI